MGRALRTLLPTAWLAFGRFAGAIAAAMILIGAGPAFAQSSSCQDGGKLLNERKSIVAAFNKPGNKKIDAREACSAFGKLITNGNETIKWVEANKDWCQIPDNFVQGIKADHENAQKLRTKACAVASQQAAMEKKARQQAQSGGGPGAGGLLGGPGLSGEYKMPQGAL